VTREKSFVTGKGDIRYWQARVRKTGARGTLNAFYSVQLQYARQRMELSLGTPNQMEAAARAKERYLFLIAHGWHEFLAKYRPKEELSSPTKLTVGQYLDAVRTQTELSPTTIENYAKRLRKIVADIAQVPNAKAHRDYRSDGYRHWLERVHAVRLESITPEKVRQWKKKFIDLAGKDELKRRGRTVTCNSMLKQSRSLFSRRNVLSKLNVALPSVLPFDGVSVEKRTDTKFYGCGVDPRELMRDAAAELADLPEEFKAFLLSLALGLRRREADMLEWSSFDFVAGTLWIQPTKWYELKTAESAAVLPVEPEIMALFRGWRAKATSEFVIESKRLPKSVSYQWYRCKETFESLLTWLRAKGVQGHKPFHTLRKLFGSAVAEAHGIYVASASLRHADISSTTQFYSDRRIKLTSGLGAVLSEGAATTRFVPPEKHFPATDAPARSQSSDRG
jgi:integrase